MLEGLEVVDWSSLTHAYGPADDVPDLLRDLASPERGARAAALHSLFGNIFHQGTRYPATAKAIPFLIELLAAPKPLDPAELLSLLTHCVGAELSPASGPWNASGPVWGAAGNSGRRVNKTDEEDEADEEDHEHGAEESEALLREIEDAAAAGIPVALAMLSAPDKDLRAAAAWFLACFRAREPQAGIATRLGARLAAEKNPVVRAALVFALGHVLPLGDESRLTTMLTADASPVARLLAAMLLARRAGPETPRAAVDLLCAAIGEPGPYASDYSKLPWQPDDVAGEVASVLRGLGRDVLSGVLPALVGALAKTNDFAAVGLLEAALDATFGDEPAPEKAGALNDTQRGLLVTLTDNQSFWMLGNALNILSERGLPSMREEMAAFLGVIARVDPVEEAKAEARMYAGMDPDRSLEAWLRAIEEAPDDAEALSAAGAILVARNEHKDALALLSRAVENNPEDGRAHFQIGYALFSMGKLAPALSAFERAEPLMEDPAMARRNRIAILQRLGRATEAAALEVEEDPEDAEGWFHRGLALVKAGRYDESIDAESRTLADIPDHANAHYTIACAYCLRAKEGDRELALEHVAQAVEAAPELAAEIAADDDFKSIRDDARFVAITKKG